MVVGVAVTAEPRCLLPVPSLGSSWGGGTAVPRALEAAWAEPPCEGAVRPVAAPLSCPVWATVELGGWCGLLLLQSRIPKLICLVFTEPLSY